MQNAWVNVNGNLKKPSEVSISIYDRGFLYGDSLYEVIRTYSGVPYTMKEHLERLEKSAEHAKIKLSQSIKKYEEEILKTLDEYYKLEGSKGTEAYIRIIVTRGVGRIGMGQSYTDTDTQFYILVQKLPTFSDADVQKGLSLFTTTRFRNHPNALSPAMKSGNYLNSVLSFLDAEKEGFDDAIMLDHEGIVTEGTTFNLFYVKKNIVVTPPTDVGILHGITRLTTMELAKKLGYEVREIRFPLIRLYEADEVFVTSTIKEVFPVLKLDHKKCSGGKPGKITMQLRKAFHENL